MIAILSETVESPISLTTGMIELRDCLRPAMKFHFERTCAHFSRESFVPTVVELPLSAKKAVTFEDIGEKVDALSQAALLWSHFSETNLVCELVPNAEALGEQPEQGQRISLDQIMVHTNKWSLREVDGALVLTCDTRVVDSARQPIKAARDAGLLMWKRIERINIHPIDRLVKYGRAALATRVVWSPRGRSIFTGSYYGQLGFEFDDIAFNIAVADALSLFDNEEGIKAGTFPLAPANQTKLRAALEYRLNCTTRTETRHPLVSELFTQGTFVVGPVGNRGWQSFGTRFGHPLVSALGRVTNFRPSQN